MRYLRHAEHHEKNRTTLHGLDQETLFLTDLLLAPALKHGDKNHFFLYSFFFFLYSNPGPYFHVFHEKFSNKEKHLKKNQQLTVQVIATLSFLRLSVAAALQSSVIALQGVL